MACFLRARGGRRLVFGCAIKVNLSVCWLLAGCSDVAAGLADAATAV